MKNHQPFFKSLSNRYFKTILFFLFVFSQCLSINEQSTYQQKSAHKPERKHKGAHVFGHLDSINIQPIIQNNFEWITIVTWGVQDDVDSPDMVFFRGDSLAMAKRDSMWKSQIGIAHAHGFRVMLKPHLWLLKTSDGEWRSDVFPKNEENWKLWSKTYRTFILHYAEIAERNQVEMFCVGTELTRLTFEKSDYWRSLIQEVRKIYSGKLIYAANWFEEFEEIIFWEDLDFIGVQAYFPLVKNKFPTVEEISEGWQQYLPSLERVSKKFNRKIVFTEMGYKSSADSAIEPWKWIEDTTDEDVISMETQVNCYDAFFKTVWRSGTNFILFM